MADEKQLPPIGSEPRGFGEHSRGLAGEYAHEQGWGLNEEERRMQPEGAQPTDTSAAKPTEKDVQTILKD